MIRAATISAYLWAMLVAPAYAQAPQALSGKMLASNCTTCHNEASPRAGPHSLAGMDKEKLAQQLRDFRDGKRVATVMQQLAKGYSEAQIEAVAEYFSQQQSLRAPSK